MNTLNLVAVITGIFSSVAVTVSIVIGLVPQFRHKAVRATLKMVDRHRAEMKAERVQITNHDDWFDDNKT